MNTSNNCLYFSLQFIFISSFCLFILGAINVVWYDCGRWLALRTGERMYMVEDLHKDWEFDQLTAG